MNADEIVAALEELPEGREAEGQVQEATERHFIFSLGPSWYSIDPRTVKEISSGLEVYPLPGCPPYVAGLLNSHGQPFTVLDIHLLVAMERIPQPVHLILNRPGDAVALGCSDIVEIAEIPLGSIARFAESEGEGGLFTASFTLRGAKVLVLSIDALLSKLRTDLG